MAGKVSVWLAARLAARSYPAQNFLAATAYFVLDPFTWILAHAQWTGV